MNYTVVGQWITCTGLGSAAAADIMIAASMCYYLAQKRTGIDRYVRSDTVIFLC